MLKLKNAALTLAVVMALAACGGVPGLFGSEHAGSEQPGHAAG
ncbi:MAG TPA: hypothetical protein VM406_04840 [Noviherbaspirillum sp.]|nr:hypothetical protein [Noviherbaspirillum sp.]